MAGGIGRPVVGALALALLAAPGAAEAQLNSIATSGNPPALVITTAVAGGSPLSVTNATTTYNVTTTTVGFGIAGSLNAAMPAGTTLRITLATPPGATSSGAVALSTTSQALVRLIPPGSYNALPITYQFEALASAGVVNSQGRTVTLTVTALP